MTTGGDTAHGPVAAGGSLGSDVVPAAIAVIPQPPLLVPELSGDTAAGTEAVRAAVREVVAALAAVAPEWIAVGADPGGRRSVPAGARGTFAGYGRDVPVALPGDDGPDEGAELPLPLLVAGWAAAGSGVRSVRGELVAPDAPVADCLALGAELAVCDAGLLVVGDGAAKHTATAPGGFDERAEAFDAVVADALDRADPDALAGLDPAAAAQLWAAGRAPWQVLAGAAAGRSWSATHRHTGAPYGVAYHVAFWAPS
ncbi:class III extradiol dioxygenase subunit B-like domain-containing protein [Pseudonocardia kongjuensis]|uniref:Class III extradiol dioxygenase subunit B-like domain-containing protein n=1 Tax=Pseudonocardia kongjuensis TaxID=102227 RepID=A0ABP4IU09_9PSEU